MERGGGMQRSWQGWQGTSLQAMPSSTASLARDGVAVRFRGA